MLHPFSRRYFNRQDPQRAIFTRNRQGCFPVCFVCCTIGICTFGCKEWPPCQLCDGQRRAKSIYISEFSTDVEMVNILSINRPCRLQIESACIEAVKEYVTILGARGQNYRVPTSSLKKFDACDR